MKKGKLQIRLFAVLALTALLPAFAWGAARLLIVRQPVIHADAIVMLSGSATYRERVQHAADLFKRGTAPRVLLTNDNVRSGWSETQQRNPFYYERAIDELKQAGVPEDRIEVLMDPILGTYDEATVVRLYCEKHAIRSLVVVTSGYHSRRALWSFKKVFAGTDFVVGIDPVETGIDTPPAATWWLKSFGWQMVPKEYAKLCCYWIGIH